MFKFITNYFKERKIYFKEQEEQAKMRDEISGLERLVKYHKPMLYRGQICIFHISADVIEVLEKHEKRIKEIEKEVRK